MTDSQRLLGAAVLLGGFCAISPMELPQRIESAIDKFLDERCKANSSTSGFYNGFFFEYYDSPFLKLPEYKTEFCSDAKLKQNMKSLAKEVAPCLLPEEKYLADFMVGSWTAYWEFVCGSDAQSVNMFYSIQGMDCMRALDSKRIEDCFSSLVYILKKNVKRNNLCRYLENAKQCFGAIIADQCVGFVAFQELNSGFFDAISKPCNYNPSFSQSVPVVWLSLLILL